MNRVHSSEEAPRSFTMIPCVVVERLEGKPAVQQRRSKRARRNPSPRMIKVTVHEKRRVNEEQPTPASSPSRKSRQRGAQTTPAHLHWCGANPPSSWLTQAGALESMLRNRITFPPFSRRFSMIVLAFGIG